MPHSSDFPYDGKPFWDTSSSTADCPDGLVPEYLDGPLPPGHPKRLEAEAAYRQSFLTAAYQASQWPCPPDDIELECAEESRRVAKENATVQVNGQTWYRAGHEVLAAHLRGRHQAFYSLERVWYEHPEGRGCRRYGDEVNRWLERVKAWATEPIDPEQPHKPPPWLDHDWDQRPPPPPKPREPGNLAWVWGNDKPPATVKDPEPVKPSQPDDCAPQTLRELVQQYPRLREPVVHGLLRRGEVMNLIAPPKASKSWLAADLALSVATGRPWLGIFPCEQGKVLIADNELHGETLAYRYSRVMEARQITLAECGDHVDIVTLRGRLKDIYGLGSLFDRIEYGRYKLAVIDAFYRVLPPGGDENSNATLAQIYNIVDKYAAELGCGFVLLHHSTKGLQSGKAIVDVGAGGGSQSRAADTHCVLRAHEEPGVVVLEAAVRSWPPPPPRCLRWVPPVWLVDDTLDPADLKQEKPRRRPKLVQESRPVKAEWTAEQFVSAFVGEQPLTRLAIEEVAIKAVGSRRGVERLLQLAEERGLVHRWTYGPRRPVQFATRPQPSNQA